MLIGIIKNVNNQNLNKCIIKVNIIVVHPVYSIFMYLYKSCSGAIFLYVYSIGPNLNIHYWRQIVLYYIPEQATVNYWIPGIKQYVYVFTAWYKTQYSQEIYNWYTWTKLFYVPVIPTS